MDPLFPKSPRFEAVRRLGEGGFGVVYEAIDREWKTPVAIKVLRQHQLPSRLRFKREFRSLADVRHPNLVALHELFSGLDELYFTMELVHGSDFKTAFRCVERPTTPASPPQPQTDTAPRRRATRPWPNAPVPQASLLPEASLRRLIPALRQLTEGLRCLHRVGLIHRDIKPTNILVTPEDRVVILDFGLVDSQGTKSALDPWTGRPIGTPGYIAPEQEYRARISPASDWWAVGVLLGEVLLGTATREALVGFLEASPGGAPPVARALIRLALQLLAPAPADRPDPEEILRCLDGLEGPPATSPLAPSEGLFVGRTHELARLEEAFERVAQDQSVWVRVRGAAGVGKSALLARFASSKASNQDTWILSATCRDRELIPFRGVDALMDQLGLELRRAPEVAAQLAGSGPFAAVCAVFEALRGGPWATVPWSQPDPTDRLESRRALFSQWRELIAAVARRRRLVLLIDDAQWGDTDSALLISALLETAVPALVVVGHRSGEEASPFLSTLEAAMDRARHRWTELPLGPLGDDDARALAALLFSHGGRPSPPPEELLEQAGGVPLMLVTLAAEASQDETSPPSFERAMARRLGMLAPRTLALLGATAVSPVPVREDVLLAAAATTGGNRDSLIALDVGRLVIRRSTSRGVMVEPFHARVREAALEAVPLAAQRLRHLELARAIEAAEGDEARPEVLFVHYAGAGENERAAVLGERAAARAWNALAFDQASRLYREASGLTADPARQRQLMERAGDALVAGGWTARGAAIYQELARESGPDGRGEVHRKAADAYLVAGYQTEGVGLWREAARDLGLGFPETAAQAATGASLALLLARFPAFGRTFGPRSGGPGRAAAKSLAALAAAKGFIATDPMRGVYFGLKALTHARAADDPDALVLSLSFVAAACLAAMGGPWRRWAVSLLDEADGRARGGSSTYHAAVVTIARAQVALFQGRWADAAEAARSGLATLKAGGQARTWEANMARTARVRSLEELGDFAHLMPEARDWLERAEEYGDVFGAVSAHLTLGIGSLATGTPAEAEAHAEEAEARWKGPGYSVQQFYASRIRILAALQLGDLPRARTQLADVSKRVRTSMIFRIPTGRIDTLWMEARVALLEAEAGDGRAASRLLSHARALAREEHTPARAHAAFIRGLLAARSGSPRATALLASAKALYQSAQMIPLSVLVDASAPADGLAGRHAAVAHLAASGIRDPLAWASCHGVRLGGPPDGSTKSENASDAAR